MSKKLINGEIEHVRKNDRAIQILVSRRERYCFLNDISSRLPFCGYNVGCAGHHVIKRRFLSTRWSPKNVYLLCMNCHQWAESNPVESEKMIIEKAIMLGIIRDQKQWEDLKKESISGSTLTLNP
jgi:hypothetical protein